ncbi:hypothetical protein DRP53_00045 [candidate division WOR-3 bacterium]|mgnify:CR=1 FL=1|uniref:PhoH-like protein n=1 Tax=candidate division WOR-3 bacterium TaxID=2052148 RepID=A0A660SM34_UNCW3|nr:MAG: hypothetical protein DRP53_00045 [candidate division WOR-3 bacterium]
MNPVKEDPEGESGSSTLSLSLTGVDPIKILGSNDSFVKYLERNLDVKIVVRNDRVWFSGERKDCRVAKAVLAGLLRRVRKGDEIDEVDIEQEMRSQIKSGEWLKESVATPKLVIRPRSDGQLKYLRAIDTYDIVICIGPAGTGKTYLAVAKAVESLIDRKITRIILTRPAVEAGESLGFLPGGYQEKVDPYLRPLYDALYDMMPYERVLRLMDKNTIEVAPLAYMRGRSLNDAFVILDEAQNTTSMQMKMFLTRMGWNTKLVINGDITQIDLAPGIVSGLIEARRLLKGIKGISFIELTEADVVRHPLVTRIIKAYERKDRK